MLEDVPVSREKIPDLVGFVFQRRKRLPGVKHEKCREIGKGGGGRGEWAERLQLKQAGHRGSFKQRHEGSEGEATSALSQRALSRGLN